jgi:hypothetical protein
MTTVTPATLTAIRLLGHNTANRFDIWQLAGARNADRRARILSALTGTRQPQSKAGVTALRAAFYNALGIIGECEAEREENFRFVCGEIIASPTPSPTPAAPAPQQTETQAREAHAEELAGRIQRLKNAGLL